MANEALRILVDTDLARVGVWIDPTTIRNLEIRMANAGRTIVRVYVAAEKDPRVIEFADRQEALEYYHKLWLTRIGENAENGARQRGE